MIRAPHNGFTAAPTGLNATWRLEPIAAPISADVAPERPAPDHRLDLLVVGPRPQLLDGGSPQQAPHIRSVGSYTDPPRSRTCAGRGLLADGAGAELTGYGRGRYGAADDGALVRPPKRLTRVRPAVVEQDGGRHRRPGATERGLRASTLRLGGARQA